jgi:low affinity Fe/Cu permease
VEIAGLVALSSVITYIVVRFIHFLRDSKEMRAVMREEMRRAREAETRCDLILKARRSDC